MMMMKHIYRASWTWSHAWSDSAVDNVQVVTETRSDDDIIFSLNRGKNTWKKDDENSDRANDPI